MQKKGGWGGSTSQKNIGGKWGANLNNDMDEDEIPFPSRAAPNKKQGGGFSNNRPATQQMNRYEEDDMWARPSGNNREDQTNKVAMKTLQNHLQGSSMQEMMANNFQGSFSNGDAKNKHKNAGGGVKSDPKFATAANKAQ